MDFKIVDKKGVVDYLEKYLKTKDASKERVDNINRIFRNVKRGDWKILFAFENDYGEQYLAIKDFKDKTIWFGDESDWGGSSSFLEDAFMSSHMDKVDMKEVLQAKVVKINKDNLAEGE